MLNDEIEVTQPSRMREDTQPVPPSVSRKRKYPILLWILGGMILLFIGIFVGGLTGYQSAKRSIQNDSAAHLAQDLIDQFKQIKNAMLLKNKL